MAVHAQTLPQATDGPQTVVITRRLRPEHELLRQAWEHTIDPSATTGWLGVTYHRAGAGWPGAS